MITYIIISTSIALLLGLELGQVLANEELKDAKAFREFQKDKNEL